MNPVESLKVKIFSDGANIQDFKSMKDVAYIKGFTTNPTLMRKAGVSDYEIFAKEVVAVVSDKPVSFEVIADDFDEMRRQALRLRELGDNVYVKIPIMNTRGQSSLPLVDELTHSGVNLNITAILTLEQVDGLVDVLKAGASAFVSVFAGRIADTGRDPVPLMKQAKTRVCSIITEYF